MMRTTNGWWLGGAAALVAGFWGCGSDSDTNGSSGSSGAGGASAAQASSGIASVVSASSSATGGGDSLIGVFCSNDKECGAGLRCITADTDSPLLGGGVANGYCTKDCLKDKDCGKGSTCLRPNDNDPGECFLGCEIGPELKFLDDELDPDKCHGRDDLRCTDLNAGTVCLPSCGKDEQCGDRKCDPRSGTCVDQIAMGKPLGALCNPDAEQPECQGFCQKFTGMDGGVCSSPCTLGDSDFFNTADCGGLDKGLCMFRPTGYGAGDFGRCTAACTEHDDCGNPTWWCFGNEFAMNGFCYTSEDCKATVDCTNAMLGPDVGCYETKYGGKCLEAADPNCLTKHAGDTSKCPPRIPLGTAAPEGSGGAGGSGGGGGAGGAGGAGGGGGAGGAGGAGGGP